MHWPHQSPLLFIFLHPCERVGAADGAFAADQRECVIFHGKCVRAVTDRLILVVDGDFIFLDIVCKVICNKEITVLNAPPVQVLLVHYLLNFCAFKCKLAKHYEKAKIP